MHQISFYKYQGAGNDFIIIDHRIPIIDKKDTKLIAQLCDRKFGIGADGLILLESHEVYDFSMVYFNADGNESSMCGNGGRCVVAFAHFLGIIKDTTQFMAIDGEHHASIDIANSLVSLQMIDVRRIQEHNNHCFLNTGSPHHVELVDDVSAIDVKEKGRRIRNELYGQTGSNINFVQAIDGARYKVRTYERGVEDETLSCGTGVTAVAIAMHYTGNTSNNRIDLESLGGKLNVRFTPQNNSYKNIWLTGPAQQVFKGIIAL